ncbi:ATP-dependent protease ATPase subunit ClpY [Thalassoglobus neptunius]|uniref:ATP-dependent protease ATPase subunit HslU n=1 Tax=Thalassoglobus neptunius TaxID=1938619 RepID=A0A5C5X536_9PLAN|nr:ATP-dependent protease ATPase subunit HslU [Thalassoglobus neptunius]TWT58020.1 ATP-dependent protease ATPase subunit ClpY [Thalassoglobus neptunius]
MSELSRAEQISKQLEFTPKEIVARLDEHIVGQADAKRAVAIALRNRWRWKQLPEEIRKEVTPKNIMMIGPTGVGKTEITRRLARITGAPFIKVEATKYTEVGYYGRDVESMIRDLVESAIQLVKIDKREKVLKRAQANVEERILDLLVPTERNWPEDPDAEARHQRTREKFREMLAAKEMEDREIDIRLDQRQSPVQVFSNLGAEQMDVNLQNMFEKIMPRQQSQRRVTVREARDLLLDQEVEALMDPDAIHEEAIRLAEDSGMVFIDEIDKVAGGSEGSKSADVSRQGVQRDLLPIVEGTTVQTRYGNVKTDNMLFIAAGAFHRARPSDLMPELQGRFPIRVELEDLTKEDFLRILTEPASSLTRQYTALLEVEGVKVSFQEDGLSALADLAFQMNQTTQNIGARRLHTVLERLLEDVSFEAPDLKGQTVVVDREYVNERLASATQLEDLSKFIL